MAAGTIPLSMTQQFDVYSQPLAGGQLYIIQAGTVSTPQDAFQDVALTIKQPYPMLLDAAGRVPQFFLDNSVNATVKIRLQDKSGVVQLSSDGVLVIGPSGGTGGGGGGLSGDPSQLFQTGDIKPRYGFGVHPGASPGWVRANGLTIGPTGSSANMPEGVGLQSQALFNYLWNTDPNLLLYSGGGVVSRGTTAPLDWSANKAIATPDWRGANLAGLADMGNTATSVLTQAYFGTDPTKLGNFGGVQSYTLLTGNLPPYTPSATVTIFGGVYTEPQTYFGPVGGSSTLGYLQTNVGASGFQGVGSRTGGSVSAISAAFNPTPQGGGSVPLSMIAPTRLLTIYIKL